MWPVLLTGCCVIIMRIAQSVEMGVGHRQLSHVYRETRIVLCKTNCNPNMNNLTIMHQFSVCLFPIQICAAATIGSKRPMPVEGVGGHVQGGPAFTYLPCCRRMQRIFSSAGRDAILFDVVRSPLRFLVSQYILSP